jgi:hypothetical protein
MEYNNLRVDLFWFLWAWVRVVILGSLATGVSLAFLSDAIQPSLAYRWTDVPFVTFLSIIGASTTSIPAVFMMGVTVYCTRGASKKRRFWWLQLTQLLGAIGTFGTMLYRDWDLFTLVAAFCYPVIGFVIWGKALLTDSQSDQLSNR